MNPAARLSAALLTALALSFPVIEAGVRGAVELHVIAVRYLAAFGFAWLAISAVAWLFETYVSMSASLPDLEDDDPLRRRADDEPTTVGVR
jgi:hypothetical protein